MRPLVQQEASPGDLLAHNRMCQLDTIKRRALAAQCGSSRTQQALTATVERTAKHCEGGLNQ
jgi:hypothetical protein